MGAIESKEFKKALEETTPEIAELLLGACRKIKDTRALRRAVERGNAEVVKLLLNAGENVFDSEALARTCWSGHKEVVQILLAAGKDYKDSKALVVACIYGHKEVVQILLAACKDYKDSESLVVACRSRHKEVVQILLAAGKDYEDSESLKRACKSGDQEVVKIIISAGKDYKDSENLKRACSLGAKEIVQILLSAGKDYKDSESLKRACESGDKEVVEILLSAGKDYKDSESLKRACESGDKEIVQILLSTRKDYKDSESLKRACRSGDKEVVQILRAADKDYEDTKALRTAVEESNAELVKLLLNAGKDINDSEALGSASKSGHKEVVQILLTAGKDYKDSNALHITSLRGHKEIVRILLAAGKEYKDSYALQLASEKGYKEIVQILLAAGKEYKDSIALIVASEKGHKEIVEILLAAGKNYKDSWMLEKVCTVGPAEKVKRILDTKGSEAFKAASVNGHSDIMTIIRSAGPDIQDSEALERASYQGHVDIVQILLGAGRNYYDSKALREASEWGHVEIVQILLAAGKEYFDTRELWDAVWDGETEKVKYLINKDKQSYLPVTVLSLDQESIIRFIRGVDKYSEETKNMKIVTIGHEGSGKTCLVKQLLGEIIDISALESTNLAELYLRRLIIDMDTKERISGRSADELMMNRLKILIETLKSTKSPETAKPEMEVKSEQDEVIYERAPEGEAFVGIYDEPLSEKLEDQNAGGGLSHRERNEPILKRSQCLPLPQPRKPKSVISPDDLTDNLKKIITLRTEKLDPNFASKAHVTIYDLGGEEIFENCHHALLTSDSIFLLVFDVKMCTTEEKEEQGIGRIVSWLQSIATYATSETESSKGSPPVLLIGSHMDQLTGTDDDKQAKVDEILEKVKQVPGMERIFNNHVKGIFTVANLHDSNIDRLDFNNIWNAIVDHAHLQSQWKKLIPGNWLLLEHELLQKKNKGEKVLTMKDMHDIDMELALPLGDNKDIELFLRYLHLSGFMLCFDLHSDNPIIVLDVQWVIDAFKCIITDAKFVAGLGDQKKQQWEQYRESGKLPSKILKSLHSSKKFMGHSYVLITSMERLGLVVKPLPKEERDEDEFYIVPCMLRMSEPGIRELLMEPSTSKTSTLCIIFNHQYIQRSIWDKFIAACVYRFQPCQFSDQERFSQIGRGSAAFVIDHFWNLFVHCKDNKMKLTMFSTEAKADESSADGNSIREMVTEILDRILKMNQQGHLEFQYYLHNDYQIHRDDNVIPAEELNKPESGIVPSAASGENTVPLTKKDYDFWFLTNPKKLMQVQSDPTLTRGPTYREVGRFAKHICKAYQRIFIELDLTDTEINQTRVENEDLSFRTQMTKLFIMCMHSKHNPSIEQIEKAVTSYEGISIIEEISKAQQHVPLKGTGLPEEVLRNKPEEAEIEIISKCLDKSYYNLFLELGLTSSTIDQSMIGNLKLNCKFKTLLQVWIRKKKNNATIENLLKAMEECKMPFLRLAQKLRENYETKTPKK